MLLDKGASVNKVYYISVQCSTIYQASMWMGSSFLKIINVTLTVLTLQGVQSPLYAAARRGYLPIVEMLVRRGAVIDKPCDVRLFVCMLIIVSQYLLCSVYTRWHYRFLSLNT